MKKALSLLLAALLLTGCAAQPAPESAASPPPASVAEESPSSPLATPSGEGAAQASQVVELSLIHILHKALGQLRELEQEDPLLHVVWDERLGHCLLYTSARVHVGQYADH